MCFTKDFPCLCGIHYPPTDHVRSSLCADIVDEPPLPPIQTALWSYELRGSSADIPRTFGTTTIESGLNDMTIKRSRLCDSFVARSERCEYVGVTKIGCERSCTYFTQNSTMRTSSSDDKREFGGDATSTFRVERPCLRFT